MIIRELGHRFTKLKLIVNQGVHDEKHLQECNRIAR